MEKTPDKILGTAWLITFKDEQIKPDGVAKIIHMDQDQAKAELMGYAFALRDEGDDRLLKWKYEGTTVDGRIASRHFKTLSKMLDATIEQVKLTGF